jgi:hypothetical protein
MHHRGLGGRSCRYLAVHVLRGHGLSADEYRDRFGLRASTSLMAPALREVFRRVQEPRLRPLWPLIAEIGRSMSPEERSARARGRSWRLEARIDQRNVALHQRTMARAREAAARLRAEGKRWWRDPREIAPLGRARLGELLADPDWKAAWAAKISAANGGRTPVSCAACGAAFVSTTGRKTCSAGCERERRRSGRKAPTCLDVRATISGAMRRRGRQNADRLRALPPAALEELPDRDRAVTTLFYGLEGAAPRTHREIAARLGLSAWAVRETLARSVARLLTAAPPDAE